MHFPPATIWKLTRQASHCVQEGGNMGSETTGPGSSTKANLQVEAGETVMLTPDSSRFRYLYRQVRPRSIDEVRTHLGLSKEATKIAKQRQCCQSAELPSVLVTPEDLES